MNFWLILGLFIILVGLINLVVHIAAVVQLILVALVALWAWRAVMRRKRNGTRSLPPGPPSGQ